MTETIGKYRVLGLLGQGAMGRVLRAEDPDIGRQVAVKVMHLSAGNEPERFRREARIVGRLSHSNIVVVHDFGFHQEQPYLVMELLDGCDLQVWMESRHGFDEQLKIIADVCAAVSFAHSQGVLHRDIKPANIQVLPTGNCKLMDFGIARGEVSDLTASGSVMGTPIYMAPEILRNDQPSAATDIYAVGMICYEMLTGNNPFVGNSLAACLNLVLTLTPTHLAKCRPDIPRRLADAVMQCIEKDPDQRAPNLDALSQVATSVTDADRTEATPRRPDPIEAGATAILTESRPPSRSRSQTPKRWGIGALVLAAVIAGVYSIPKFLDTSSNDPLIEPAELTTAEPTPTAVPTDPPEPTEKLETQPIPPVPTPIKDEPGPPRPQTDGTPPLRSPTPRPRPTPEVRPTATPAPRSEQPPTPTPIPITPTPNPSTPVPVMPQPAPNGPILTAVEPTFLRLGGSGHLRLSGTGFQQDMTVEILRGRRKSLGFRLSRVTIISPTLAEIDVIVDDNIPLGRYSIVLVGPDGRRSRRLELEVNL